MLCDRINSGLQRLTFLALLHSWRNFKRAANEQKSSRESLW